MTTLESALVARDRAWRRYESAAQDEAAGLEGSDDGRRPARRAEREGAEVVYEDAQRALRVLREARPEART